MDLVAQVDGTGPSFIKRFEAPTEVRSSRCRGFDYPAIALAIPVDSADSSVIICLGPCPVLLILLSGSSA
jgi:hypothetical protein